MKIIDIKEYKGFRTEFIVLPKVDEFLKLKDVKLKDHLLDTFHWYEHELFEVLDPELSSEWKLENEKRKKFKVYYYGIIERWINKNPEGFEEKLDYLKEKMLSEGQFAIHPKNEKPFVVRYKIILDQ